MVRVWCREGKGKRVAEGEGDGYGRGSGGCKVGGSCGGKKEEGRR